MTEQELQEKVLLRIHALIEALIRSYNTMYPARSSRLLSDVTYLIVPGRRYHKVIMDDNQRSIHAFVDKNTGDVYKPASWNAPAAHIRYNLLDDESFETCLEKADWAGSYLYL